MMPARRRRSAVGIGRPLAVPGALVAPLTLTRAQPPGSRSTVLGADGIAWSECLSDQLRAAGTAGRLLIEPARTNGIPNPRADGLTPGVIGSGGVLPTGWTVAVSTTGITREVIGQATVNGLPGLRIRVSGTPAANANIQFQTATSSAIAASAGQVWTSTAFYRLHAGSLTNITNIRHRTRTVGGASDTLTVLSPAMDGTLRRYGHPNPITCPGATTHIYAELTSVITAGLAIDATIDVIAPQLEIGPASSTPILPPAGTPAASTRGADIVTATLASLGITGL